MAVDPTAGEAPNGALGYVAAAQEVDAATAKS